MNRFLAKLALSLVAAALVVPSAAVQPAFAAPDSSQQLAQLNRQLSDAQAKLEQQRRQPAHAASGHADEMDLVPLARQHPCKIDIRRRGHDSCISPWLPRRDLPRL